MAKEENTRRKFLKMLGLSASATLVSTSALAAFTNKEDIKKLNPQQQEFMLRYGKWMDEFTDVIRIQKEMPDNKANQLRMIALTEKAEHFQPELNEFMKDRTFAMIYHASIERLKKEI